VQHVIEAVYRGDAGARGGAIAGGAQGLEVVHPRRPAPLDTHGDPIGEYAREPQRDVPHVRLKQELAVAARRLYLSQEVRQVRVPASAVFHALPALASPVVDQQRRHVVAQHAVIDAALEQRVPHRDVEKQGKRGPGGASARQELVQHARIVQHIVKALARQARLRLRLRLVVDDAEGHEGRLDFRRAEAGADVGHDHWLPPCGHPAGAQGRFLAAYQSRI
jgi:hypothetical protein